MFSVIAQRPNHQVIRQLLQCFIKRFLPAQFAAGLPVIIELLAMTNPLTKGVHGKQRIDQPLFGRVLIKIHPLALKMLEHRPCITLVE